MAKETAIKMHLYISNVELTESQVHILIKELIQKISSKTYPVNFQIHEVEVTDDGK
jgi:hypothetical protein